MCVCEIKKGNNYYISFSRHTLSFRSGFKLNVMLKQGCKRCFGGEYDFFSENEYFDPVLSHSEKGLICFPVDSHPYCQLRDRFSRNIVRVFETGSKYYSDMFYAFCHTFIL